MIQYNYWGSGSNEPPEHLKTKKQLSELGLSPLKPMGFIETTKYTLYLYDPNDSESVKPKRKISQSQKTTLAKGRRTQQYNAWYRREGYLIEQLYVDENSAIKWAREVLAAKDNYVILDTETTGLSSNDEVIQIAIVSLDGTILLDSLVKPTIPISKEAFEVHGISDNDVIDAPSFPTIYPHIVEALANKKLLVYNAAFDTKILKHCCQLYKLPILRLSKRSECVMEWYAQYCGEWSSYYNDYKLQPLNSNHNALDDCLAVKRIIETMAASELINIREQMEAIYAR